MENDSLLINRHRLVHSDITYPGYLREEAAFGSSAQPNLRLSSHGIVVGLKGCFESEQYTLLKQRKQVTLPMSGRVTKDVCFSRISLLR